VAAGGSVIDPQALVARRARLRESPLARLTPRELDVLREMAQGHGNAGIATRLSLSESSVEKYVNSIFAELGLTAEIQVHPPGRGGAALPARLRTGQPACAPVTDDADAVQVMGEPPVTPSTSPVM
jgi:DNA-binding CsgD family transcriptional regulator